MFMCLYSLSLLLLPSLNGPRTIIVTEEAFVLKGAERSYMSVSSHSDHETVEAPEEDRGVGEGVEMHTATAGGSNEHDRFSDTHTKMNPLLVKSEPSSPPCNQRVSSGPVSFYGRDVPLSETVTMWRCYALMAIFMCIAGSGLLVINNVQAIAQAVDDLPSPFFVTLLSLANASGRLFVGIIADTYSDYISRLQLLSLIALVMCVTQFILSIGVGAVLYPCLLMVGLMFGATFSNIAATTADLFGSKYVGSNYGFIDLAPAIGSYVFATGLVAVFYPSDGHPTESADKVCRGAHCFQGAFLVASLSCLLASVFGAYMHTCTRISK
jgi:hypothetical protein